MKRVFCLTILLLLLLSLSGCATTQLEAGAAVELHFVYGDKEIHATLTSEEAAQVIEILDGRTYSSIWDGTPSCGFDVNIRLTVNGHSYAIACDTCRFVQDLDNLRYFSVSQEGIDYIHALFETYGGHFPCV